MKTTALKVFFTIFIIQNLNLSSNGDDSLIEQYEERARSIRSLESFIYRRLSELQNVPDYQSLTTLSNNIKQYLGFPLTILKKTGRDIANEFSNIFRDTFNDDEDSIKDFIPATTSVSKL